MVFVKELQWESMEINENQPLQNVLIRHLPFF